MKRGSRVLRTWGCALCVVPWSSFLNGLSGHQWRVFFMGFGSLKSDSFDIYYCRWLELEAMTVVHNMSEFKISLDTNFNFQLSSVCFETFELFVYLFPLRVLAGVVFVYVSVAFYFIYFIYFIFYFIYFFVCMYVFFSPFPHTLQVTSYLNKKME